MFEKRKQQQIKKGSDEEPFLNSHLTAANRSGKLAPLQLTTFLFFLLIVCRIICTRVNGKYICSFYDVVFKTNMLILKRYYLYVNCIALEIGSSPSLTKKIASQIKRCHGIFFY